MANWIINLNWDNNIEIWINCRRNGRAAIGWDTNTWSEEHLAESHGFQRAIRYFKEIQTGDRVISFLKDRRLGSWGTVTKEYDENNFDPQLSAGMKEAKFGRVIHVRWQDDANPPLGLASRMRATEVTGFTCLSSVNRLSEEAFSRLKEILEDSNRWEPISELSDERDADDRQKGPELEEWHAPLRESALRKILAEDLELLEPGLQPFNATQGAEEFHAGEAGRIDLFCKDKYENPVVIELKRDSTSDKVIGQLARYMGYVAERHLKRGQHVRGMIVAHDADRHLELAIKSLPNVELKLYDVAVKVFSACRNQHHKRGK